MFQSEGVSPWLGVFHSEGVSPWLGVFQSEGVSPWLGVFQSEGISLSHPGLALMVAIKVAELRCMDVEEVLSQVRRNTHHMYNI